MSNEYKHGKECRKKGYSIYYNPYRNKGSSHQFSEWENGWNSVS